MKIIRGYTYLLKPTPEQETAMAQSAGVVRLVYNLALEQRKTWGGRRYAGGRPRNFHSKSSSGELSELRKAFDWIGAVSQTAQNQALIDLDLAFDAFFKGSKGYPRPRRKGQNDSFRQAGREIKVRRLNAKWSEVQIPKIGWVRFRDTRPLPIEKDASAKIRSATIRRRPGGCWQISIAVAMDADVREAPSGCIGIDRGVAIPFAMSTGELVHLPDAVARREKRARRAQKVLSRRKRGSKRHARARARLARLKASSARTREHLAHCLTRRLVRDHGMVAIEDLKIRNMTASARGSLEAPGARVAQKSGLNRAILNVGWYTFETMLEYKLQEVGGIMIKVDPRNTSRTCSACGYADATSRKSQAAFVCTACGMTMNADINAARNILARALSGEEHRRWNTPLLDVEGKASAPYEASTQNPAQGLNGP